MEVDIPLFESLPEPALELIRSAVEKRHYARGEVMMSEGDARGELFVLLSGEASVSGRDWHGKPKTLASLEAGQCFGELSMLSGEPASATVEAATEAEVWVLPHAAFVSIADAYPELARNLSMLLGERLRRSNERQLHAQRGKLVSLWAGEFAPWAFWLAYRIAAAVANYSRQPMTFLDMSGQAGHLLGASSAVTLLAEVTSESSRSSAGRDAAKSDGRLTVVSASNDEPPTDRQVSAVLDRLRDQSAFVLAFTPRGAPAVEFILPQADSWLALTPESEDCGESQVGPPDSFQGRVVISDRQTPPTVGEMNRAHKAEPMPICAIVPGGVKALEGDVAAASLSGDAIGRLARTMIGKTVGLALGGGGAKGYAHIGVLSGLARAGVPIDYVTGCSIGAPIAAGVAAGWHVDRIRETLDKVSRKAVRPNLPLVSLLSNRAIRSELRAVTNDGRFEDLLKPLGIVAVNIETGEEVLLQRGLIWRAMVASMAYPGIYEPVRIGACYLVDGGVLNPVPVSGAVSLGADVVISSNLSGTVAERMANVGSSGPPRRRLIVENITRTLEIMQSKIVEESATRADVAIQPSFGTPPGMLDFKRGRELEHVGLEAAEEQLPKLRSVLRWLS